MRENLRLIAVGLSLLAVVGCGETATAPQTTSAQKLSAAAPKFDYSVAGAFGDQYASFVVTSAGGTYSAGSFTVNFPANAVCDPDLSSYGEGTWDSSCIPLSRAIRVTAQVRLGAAGIAIDFSPDIRFVPGKIVTLSTDMYAPYILANRSFFAAYPQALRPLALYYSPTIGGTRVADYLSDPSLITHVDLTTGRVWRRVKHFSGYSATSGEACDPSPGDPDCIMTDGA
jgi:hypothetical protein